MVTIDDLRRENNRLRAVAEHWWWRDREAGTVCVVCGASCHFDLGIDDIQHRPDCPVPGLRRGKVLP